MKQITEVGQFLKWGEAITIDVTKKMMKILPISQPEKLVEIPNEDGPAEDLLDLRCSSF